MPSFKLPGDPIKDRLADYVGSLILILPKEYGSMDVTINGVPQKSTALFCAVLIPQPEKGSGKYFNLGDRVPVYWKNVQAQLDANIGEWTGGRLVQGTKSNPRAYSIEDPKPDDIPVLEAVLTSLEDF